MVLNLPEMENLFPHSKELYQGLGKIRIGQATIVVALDGSGDTSDVQEGINMLPSTGGVVYIKEGTYTIILPIIIASNNVSVIGAGKSTKIATTGNIRAFDIGYTENVTYTGIVIADMFLYGSGAGGQNDSIVTKASESLIDNIWIENFGGAGIQLAASAVNKTISSCNITDNAGIGIDNVANGAIIINNAIFANGNDGISTAGHSHIISNNRVYNNERNGINLTQANNCIISGNIVTGNDSGNTAGYSGIILSALADKNIIANNRCENNDKYEIDIANANCDDNLVFGNICIGADHVGPINDAGTNTQFAHNITT